MFRKKETRRKECADPEVRHSDTEESVFYFIRKKYNLFWNSLVNFCRMFYRCMYEKPEGIFMLIVKKKKKKRIIIPIHLFIFAES